MIIAAAAFLAVFASAPAVGDPLAGADYAAIIPPMLTVKITGDAAPRDFFIPHLVREVEKNTLVKSGGGFSVDHSRIIAPRYIRRGHTATALVSVLSWGRGYRSTVGYSAVRIENIAVEDFGRCSRLYVSNSPELLTQTGVLLEGGIGLHEAVRYLVHHKNGSGRPLTLVMLAENRSGESGSLQLVEGPFETDILESPPGHRASLAFTRNLMGRRGFIIDLPPGETAIHRYEVRPDEIISGIGEMRLLDGDDIRFVIKTLDPMRYVTAWVPPIGDFKSSRGHGIYGEPYIHIEEEFELGGRWKFINIGDSPMKSINGDHTPLKGNYGVTYTLEIDLVNPFPQEEKAELCFSPSAGPSRGVILVDGELVKTNLVKPHDHLVISEFEVGPGARRTVNVEIIPESGSYYPVRLVFRSRNIQSASR